MLLNCIDDPADHVAQSRGTNENPKFCYFVKQQLMDEFSQRLYCKAAC